MDEEGVFISRARLVSLNKCKRRPLNPLKWQNNDNKSKKDKGLEYKVIQGNKAGTVVPALVAPTGGKPCKCRKPGCNLPSNCYVEFYKLFRSVNANKQNQILSECVEINEPTKRAVDKENAIKYKQNTYSYSLKVRGKRHRICRVRLLDTFKITFHRMRTIISKMERGCLTFDDGRGKSVGVHPKLISEDFKNKIRDHIRSFRTFESHYCRGTADADRRYLDKELNVRKMLAFFNDAQEKNNDRICKYDAYNHIFKTEFDLKFGLPRKDTCNFCDEKKATIARTKNQAQIDALQKELTMHQDIAAAARKMHKEDENNNDVETFSITADMQKVLFVPALTCSSAYFKITLSTFNLGIHATGKKDADMFIWDETIAEHSSKDVLSCVYKYVLTNFKPLQPKKSRNFIIWSDRFVGQFNNCYLILFMKYLVDFKFFTCVEHKMFATGHSWMVCDRDFGLIEKRYKQLSPLVPDDIEEIIATARVTVPFKINKMRRTDFYDFSILTNYVSLPSSLQVTKYHLFRYRATNPNVIQTKQYHNSENWTSFNLTIRTKNGFTNLKKLPLAYKGPIKLHDAKAKDLRDLMCYIKLLPCST